MIIQEETALLISLLRALVHCYISTYGSCKTEKSIDNLTKVLCLGFFTAGEWKIKAVIISVKGFYGSFSF